MRRGRGREFGAGLDETSRDFRKIKAKQSHARGEYEIEPGGYERLMMAINFPQAAFRTIAMDGVAHGSPGGHHPDARFGGGRFRGAHPPGQKEGPAIDSAALLADCTEVVIAPQTLPGAKVHLRPL